MFHLECEPDDPRLARVSEAALEVWSDLAPLTELRSALDAGLQLGKLARSESWVRCLGNLTDAETSEFGDAGTYWLQAVDGSPVADRVSRHSEGCGASTSQSILGFTPT